MYLPVSSSILSHSSKTKTSRLSSLRVYFLTKARTLPGVPMMMWGHFSLSLKSFSLSYIGTPPKTTAVLSFGRYLVNLSNSFLIWKASSLTLQRIKAEFGFGSFSSNFYRIEMTKTAVLPIPETAWQRISSLEMAAGMQFCWTSEGCSKPFSVIDLINSCLRRKSLKFWVWTSV